MIGDDDDGALDTRAYLAAAPAGDDLLREEHAALLVEQRHEPGSGSQTQCRRASA